MDTEAYLKRDASSFHRMLKTYRRLADQKGENGCFEFTPGDDLGKIARKMVPDAKGVYIVRANDQDGEVLYVGKSGTMNQDGTFADQGLRGRIPNKQDGSKRQAFWEREMAGLGLRRLYVEWIVTFRKATDVTVGMETLPAKAEAELIQAFYNDNSVLPRWNKKL